MVQASWGAPVEFSTATVSSSRPEADNLQRIALNIGSLASGYTKPGQFIQAKLSAEGKPGFFAIASTPPSENTSANFSSIVELLVKGQGETAEALTKAAAGEAVMVSPVMGGGFPVERIPAQDFPTVLLFATGSGISPIKAVIESGLLGLRKDIRLYYGVRNASHMAFKESIPSWEMDYGVRTIPVYSDDKKGYVQDVFAANPDIENWQGVAAVLCGQKGMCEGVTDLLTAKGVAKEHILLNF